MTQMPHRLGIAIHIEPERPIELADLLVNLRSVGDEYQRFARSSLGTSSADASRLYVGSVKPGSIDIFLQPELIDSIDAGLAVLASAGPVDAAKAVLDFARRLGGLLETFRQKPAPSEVSIRDCDNAMNIARNTVEAGGTQTINYVTVQGDFQAVYTLDLRAAKEISSNAAEVKAQLQLPAAERKNAVALTWKTFDRSPAKTSGQRSPDKGVIEEIDAAAKAVLFGDDEAGLKGDILSSEENPMQMVYFVDVEVVRVDEKIRAYRIVGFHGKEPLEV